MKKLFAFLFVVIVIVLVAYLASGYILERAFKMGLDYLETNSKTFGVVLESPAFSNARLTSYDRLTLDGFSTLVKMAQANASVSNVNSSVVIEETTLALKDWKTRTLELHAKGIELTAQGSVAKNEATAVEKEGGIKDGEVTFDFQVPRFDVQSLREELQNILRDALLLSRTGKTPLDLQLRALSVFIIGKEPVQARIWTEKEGDQYVLKMSPEDIVNIAKTQGDPLREAEAKVLSAHPIQAPEMMRITHHAKQTAFDAHHRNPVIPEDAYRHVLWSWGLTKAFGAELAKQLTDAHEAEGGGGASNTPGEHDQDFSNNAMGREYAQAGLQESDLLEHVLTDPRVIRDDQVK